MNGIGKVTANSAVDQVGQKLRQWILREGLIPGDRVPSYRELAERLDVSYLTVKRGVDEMVKDGVVTCLHGKGVFVAEGVRRKRQALRQVFIIFPASMHQVLSYVYASDMARGILSALEPAVACHIRCISSDGLVFGDDVDDVDAVILPGMENDEYLRMAVKWGRPVVVLDYCSDAVSADFVACDNRAAARRCVDHLANLGHRRIAYLPGAGVHSLPVKRLWDTPFILRPSDTRERREGVLEAAAARGLPEPRVISQELSLEQVFGFGPNPVAAGVSPADEEKMAGWAGGTPAPTTRNRSQPVAAGACQAVAQQRLVAPADFLGPKENRPTALVLDNENEAAGTIRGLAEWGLRVPEDVSVCAVAGAGGMTDCPELTQCRFNFYRMGQKAVEILRERFARPGEPVNRIHRIGFEWVEGRTCGARA